MSNDPWDKPADETPAPEEKPPKATEPHPFLREPVAGVRKTISTLTDINQLKMLLESEAAHKDRSTVKASLEERIGALTKEAEAKAAEAKEAAVAAKVEAASVSKAHPGAQECNVAIYVSEDGHQVKVQYPSEKEMLRNVKVAASNGRNTACIISTPTGHQVLLKLSRIEIIGAVDRQMASLRDLTG